MRTTIYSREGVPIAEIDVACARSWKLNRYGEATFTLAITDPKCTAENLRFGNYITIEHESLPTWGGVIDVPRTWGPGKVTARCYSAEYLMTWRRGEDEKKVDGTGGQIFRTLVADANAAENLLLVPGSIFTGGPSAPKKMRCANFYEAITQLSKDTSGDWSIDPVIGDDNRLTFSANWYEKRGEARNDTFRLREGHNIGLIEQPMVEQGRILNDIEGYGQGAKWDSRDTVAVKDTTSIGRYGLRQTSVGFDVDSKAALQSAVESKLAREKEPRKTFRVEALDVGETFGALRIGNVMTVELLTTGFADYGGFGTIAPVRITGISYDELEGKTVLTFQEENTDE